MSESDQQQSVFRFLTQLGISDAKPLLDSFEEGGVRFELTFDDSAIRTMSPGTARFGGTFGQGAIVSISVRSEDWEQAQGSWRKFCGFNDMST